MIMKEKLSFLTPDIGFMSEEEENEIMDQDPASEYLTGMIYAKSLADDLEFGEQEIGFDFVSTTLCGYTPYSINVDGPNIELIKKCVSVLNTPLIAEGKIHYPYQLKVQSNR